MIKHSWNSFTFCVQFPELGTDNGKVDTDNQQPTPDKRDIRQPPTATPENQQTAIDNQHPTTNNEQPHRTPTNHPTTNSQQPTWRKCSKTRLDATDPSPALPTLLYSSLFATNWNQQQPIDNVIIVLSPTTWQYHLLTWTRKRQGDQNTFLYNRWPTLSIDKFLVEQSSSWSVSIRILYT